jgi:hypothetical protein
VEVIDVAGHVAARAPVGPSTVQECAPGLPVAQKPPVSASDHKAYFRDGDTKIRFLTPDGQTGDVTTVPGSTSSVSFFAVSPDDQRIAVLVDDLSSTVSVKGRLYVEDLAGGGHHADIYSFTTARSAAGLVPWPMGWHGASLLLSLLPACSSDVASASPAAWHVVDAATADRRVDITNLCGNGALGTLSLWPSPSGVACVDRNSSWVYDWTGKNTLTYAEGGEQSSLAPGGRGIFQTLRTTDGTVHTEITTLQETGFSFWDLPGKSACLWIDDDHLLAPDAVITFTGQKVAPLPEPGQCAGRLPGGL